MISDILSGEGCNRCKRLLLHSMVSWVKRDDVGLYEGDLAEFLWYDVICTCGAITSVCAVAQPIGYMHTRRDKLFLSAPTVSAIHAKERWRYNYEG